MLFFFFNDTATTEIYTLSLHDALPICHVRAVPTNAELKMVRAIDVFNGSEHPRTVAGVARRSEEHTSELQSRQYLVCRLLLEKKKLTVARFINSVGHSSAVHTENHSMS